MVFLKPPAISVPFIAHYVNLVIRFLVPLPEPGMLQYTLQPGIRLAEPRQCPSANP